MGTSIQEDSQPQMTSIQPVPMPIAEYGRNDGNRGGNGGNGGNRSRSNNDQGNGRISSKQHKYILDLIKEQGMTKSQLNQQCVQAYGSVLAHISRHDASSLIDELLAR